MAPRLSGGSFHPELAGAVGRQVEVEVSCRQFGCLASAGRFGELGVQHPAVSGESAAAPGVCHDDLVSDRFGAAFEGIVPAHPR